MSLKDLQEKGASAVATQVPRSPDRRPATSPGATAMMQPTMDALNARAKAAETRAALLEEKIKDLESTALPVACIEPNPWQPRRVFDQAEIEKLGDSIAEIGLIQPIVVRRKSVRSSDTLSSAPSDSESVRSSDTQYQIIAGERRYRAHALIGKPDIKAIVIDVADDAMAIMALAENIDRKDLSDYEIAVAIRNAQDSFPNKKEMARSLGKQRTELYSYLKFFKLPAFITDDLESNPAILGRTAAEDIAAVINKHSEQAVDAAKKLWPHVKSGSLDQTKLAPAIEASILRGATARTERDIKKLFVGKEQAGSITRDASSLTIKIKAAALTADQEKKLRDLVKELFPGQ